MPIEEFWSSLHGILARIADMAHDFTWRTISTAVRETVIITEAEVPPAERHRIAWVTMGDVFGYDPPHGVCSLCEENEDEYDIDEPMPEMPAHVFCRCHWKIVT